MSLPLTPQMLVGGYEFLRTTPPIEAGNCRTPTP